MVYQGDRILHDVRVAMDMDGSSERLRGVDDRDTLRLEGVIESVVEDAAELVVAGCAGWRLEDGHWFGDVVVWGDMESGYVVLPDDFLRLVRFEMSDWSGAVTEAEEEGTARALRQRSRYKGLRGTWERPVCVLGRRAEGRVLEFYSCRSCDAEVKEAMYAPKPRRGVDGSLDLSKHLYRGFVMMAAGLAYLAMSNSEDGQRCLEQAKQLIA